MDTYDTLNSGIPNFIIVAMALNKIGYKAIGIRLDSGNLSELSKQTRVMFEKAEEVFKMPRGWAKALQIVASNDLNEDLLLDLREKGHQIDSFGIGTNLITCQKQPALGMVYKLVEIENDDKTFSNVMKISSDISKSTIPCRKRIFRVKNSENLNFCDVMTMSNEDFTNFSGELFAVDPKN